MNLFECVLFSTIQELHPTIEDTYVASVDTGRGSRDILRIYDTAGLQGTVQVHEYRKTFGDFCYFYAVFSRNSLYFSHLSCPDTTYNFRMGLC